MCIDNCRIANATQDLAVSLLSSVKRQLEETRAMLDDPQFVEAAGKIDAIAIAAKQVGVELTMYQWIEQRRVLMIKEEKSAKARRSINAIGSSIDEAMSIRVKACGSVDTPQLAAAKRVQSGVDTLRSLFATEAVGYAVWQARTNHSVLATLDVILSELSQL